jgi:hypothetical protein
MVMKMTCIQLQDLQQNFAALVMAAERQDELERMGMVRVEDRDAVKLFRQELQKRMTALGAQLSEHIQQHNCAN